MEDLVLQQMVEMEGMEVFTEVVAEVVEPQLMEQLFLERAETERRESLS